MPGVNVRTGVRPGSTDQVVPIGGTYFVAGQAERGDTAKAIDLRSMADYADKLGARVSYGALYDDLEAFFAEGGAQAFVARVVGPAATKGSLTLNDRDGTPDPTVTLTAKSAGAWSSTVTVEVANGVLANTFSAFVRLSGVLVEQYLDQADPVTFIAAVNNNAASLLTAANANSPTAAPNNNPAVLVATALSAGNDDRAAIVAAHYTAALDRFGTELGGGAVAIPGQTSANVGAGLIAHVKANERLALLATAAAQTVAQAKTAAGALRATAGSEFAGLFWPWVKAPDGAGGTRAISPEGYIAGVRARAHRDGGPWLSPAGAEAVARHVVDVETIATRAEIDDLATNRVNPIWVRAGAVRNYGWRSLSSDQKTYLRLKVRDVLDFVAHQARLRLEDLVHGNVDPNGQFLSKVRAELTADLEPMRLAGGLWPRIVDGVEVDPGYVVDVGPTVNTSTVLAGNEVRADVGVRPTADAELITVTVTAVALDVPL